MPGFDVIVVGGGHNALVCSAYLARAGRNVLVLEATDRVGGAVGTDDLGAGFRSPATFDTVEHLSASVIRELALARHGLEIVPGTGPTVMLGDGAPVSIDPNDPVTSFNAVGSADGAAYRDLERLLSRMVGAMAPLLHGRLPPIEPEGLGGLVDLLGLGWRLRRLGKHDMPEALRLLPMSLRDLCCERFSDSTLQAAVAFPGLAHSWLGPLSAGGGLSLLLHRAPGAYGLFAAPAFVRGGPGALAATLRDAAVTAGAEIRLQSRVRQIVVAHERVCGVVLDSGEHVRGAAVVSTVDPRTTLTRLLEPGWLDTDVLDAARNIRSRATVSFVRFGLAAAPDFGLQGISLGGRLRIGASLTYLERAFDNAKYGRIPEEPMIEMTLPSVASPDLAPAGKHVVHARVQYTPHTLADTTWDSSRDVLVQRVAAIIERHAPGFQQLVEVADAVTPTDIERRWSLAGGHLYHAEMALDQALYLRPIPGRYDHAMPLPGLYLGGPGCHPGGGVTGRPGRNAAMRVLEDG